jgi:mannose-6-phosphate isomerase
VQRGDIVNIPAGLIHALTRGTVVAEIQQNSDITYRLYDFGRLGADGLARTLHVADALEVTDFSGKLARDAIIKTDTRVGFDKHFSVEKHEISAAFAAASNLKAFSVYTCVEGALVFEAADFSVSVSAAESVFIPAALGNFMIVPRENAVFLKSEPNCPPLHITK